MDEVEAVKDEPNCVEPGMLRGSEFLQQDPQSLLKNWEIRIRILDMGCVIDVGCKSFAFSDVKYALEEVSAYINDPITIKNKYVKN